MSHKLPSLTLLLIPFLLSGCVSTAEGILDSVAGAAGSVGSNALFNAKEEECRADPALLAKKAVDLEFYKEKSFLIAQKQCDSKFDVKVDEALFSQNYDNFVRDDCFTSSGAKVQSTYCSEATRKLKPQVSQAASNTQTSYQHSGANYNVVSLSCDHQMFKRKRNLAPDARIEVESTACGADGRCYDKAHLVDGNRSLSPSPSFSWSNDPDSPRRVDFIWDSPAKNVEQIYLVTPHTVPIMHYTIEIVTPDGQQYQMARVLGNKEQKLCHRFNPIDVKSMFITGLGHEINPDQILLNEVVVR